MPERTTEQEYLGDNRTRHTTTGLGSRGRSAESVITGYTDPLTGEHVQSSRGYATGHGPRGARRAERRAERRAGRGSRGNREQERERLWYGQEQEATEEATDLADLLAEGAPSYEDLLGGLEEAYMEGSELAGAEADPDAIAAQMRALGELEAAGGKFGSIYDQGGYTDVERGQIQQALMQAGREDAARQAAIRNEMAMTGMGNSGLQYAQQMLSQQGAANRGSEAATDISVAAQQRALQALEAQGRMAGQAGGLAGQARGQSFGEAATRGQAADDMSRTNLERRDWYQQRRGDAAQQGFENRTTATGMQIGTRDTAAERAHRQIVEQRDKKAARQAQAIQTTQTGTQALGSLF